MRRLLSGLIVAFALALAACAPPAAQTPGAGKSSTVKVVATTGMIADLAKKVGGDRVEVVALMGAGTDPHLYKPTAGDLAKLEGARLVLTNGLELEGRMGETLAKMKDRGVATLAVGEAKGLEGKLREAPGFKGKFDPHIWFDVLLWREVAVGIAETLSDIDPEGAAVYNANLESTRASLMDLHREVLDTLGKIPAERRILITAHDAFGYFGRAYGFQVEGIQGVSTATEAGTGEIRRLADLISERKIPAIFAETSVAANTIEALQAAVKSRGHEVKIGEKLYSDAMGAEGSPEGTYEGMIRANVRSIVQAMR